MKTTGRKIRDRKAAWRIRNFPAINILAMLCSLWFLTGCKQDMADQPRYEPQEVSDFFADKQASRPHVTGTVARGHLRTDDHFYQGKVDGELVETFPLATVKEKLKLTGSGEQLWQQVLERGQDRFETFCSHCHGRVGGGISDEYESQDDNPWRDLVGMVVQRGFPSPPTYHTQRLRDMPLGHFFDVITNGLGRMPAHDVQIPPADRWAIVAYIRALQRSQHASMDQLQDEDIAELKKSS